MTRISIYSKDVDVRGNDRWIGSDAQNQYRTKNFTPDNVATYFNENQVIDLGVELRYFYDTLDPLQERVYGSITFETEIGPQVNFSAISTFILSKYTMGHTDVSQFLDFLIGSNVLLSRANNINMFGYYKIDNIEPYLPDPNFFVVTLTFDAGNGYMKEDEDYFISLVQFEQEAPDVPTKTSDLINDGEDGVHPFITAEDITTPTLQSVTDEGNTTTNDIIVDSALYESFISNNYITVTTKGALSGIGLLSSGVVSFGNGSVYSYLSSDVTNLNVYFRLPNKLAGTYTLATTADIPVVTGFVPYTGATGNVNLGDYNYIGGNLELNGISTDGGSINLRQSATNTISGDGYTSIYSLGTDSVSFYLANNFDGKQFNFLTNGITLNDTLDYTLPSTSGTIALISDIPSAVTSVGLTMPSAFSVANSPITSSGNLEVTGAGVVSQYVRGDGSLANFPTSTGGGASLSFYLNGSVSQGTIGGVAFREMDRTPILGAGTDFTINANGYIQSFITDATVPNLLEIPAGNWNFETYFSASSGGGTPSFYVELYKWNGTTLSLIASNSATPEGITNGTSIDAYFSALAVPQTTLLATDRLAVRIYVTHSGRTITLHTEDNHLCQVVTTFSTGLTALNGLTTQVQSFATGTSGTDFGISSASSTHTFNLPTASAANRGALSSTDWSTFNGKQDALVSGTNIKTINGASVLGSGDLVVGGSTSLAIGTTPITSGTIGRVLFQGTGDVLQQNGNLFWDNTNNRLGVGTATPANTLHLSAFNLTNSQARIGSLEIQSYSLNNTWFGDNVYFNGTNFIARNTGATGLFYFLANEGQFRLNQSVAAGTALPTSNTVQLKINSNGTFAVGTNITEPNNTYTGAKFIVFGSSGNVGMNTTTDAGFKLDVNGTARVQNLLQVSQTITAQGAANFPTSGSGVTLYYNNNGGNIAAISNFSTSAAAQLCIQPSGSKVALGTGGEAFTNTNNNFRQKGGAEFALNGTTQSFDFYVNEVSGNVSLNLIRPSNTVGYGLSYKLQARNSTNTVVDYSAIGTLINTNTAGSHSGSLLMYTTNAGTLSERMRVSPSGSLLINTTTEIASSQLTVESTTKGFLPPRMTNAQRLAIATPAVGLMVYCTDVVEGLYINKSTGWTFIG